MKVRNATIQLMIILMLVAVVISACAANEDTGAGNNGSQATKPGNETMSLSVLHSSSQCSRVSGHQWITSQSELEKVLKASRGAFMSPHTSQSPVVDFDKYAVLLLSMGQQRSGGYAIKLEYHDLVIKDSVATVRIQWQEPRPGMMVTQALTQPCVFIQVPVGDYQLLRVVDQRDELRAELPVN